jgi:NADH:ubiquinone oxidoreductase subunit 6 (subunit J)
MQKQVQSLTMALVLFMLLQLVIAVITMHDDWLEFTVESYQSDLVLLVPPLAGMAIAAYYGTRLRSQMHLLAVLVIATSVFLAFIGISFVSEIANIAYCLAVYTYYSIVVFLFRRSGKWVVRYVCYYAGLSIILLSTVLGTVLYFIPTLLLSVKQSDECKMYNVASKTTHYHVKRYRRYSFDNSFTQFIVYQNIIPYVLDHEVAKSAAISMYASEIINCDPVSIRIADTTNEIILSGCDTIIWKAPL